MGGTVVAVSDRHGAVHNAAGLDVPALRRHVRARPPFGGSLRSFPGGSPLPLSELLPLECDVFIPAAIGGVINERTARSVKAGVVVEAANAATTPAGDAVLRERGVAVVPDIYASGGGVTVSFFEWVQVRPRRARAGPALALASPSTLDPPPPPHIQNYRWDAAEVDARLAGAMGAAFRRVHDVATARAIPLRTAAFVVGLQSVTRATMNRGFD